MSTSEAQLNSFVERGRKWLGKPKAERNRLLHEFIRQKLRVPFDVLSQVQSFVSYHGYSSFGRFYAAYQPDSHVTFRSHEAYDALRKRFVAGNPWNNTGDIPRLWSFILNLKQVMNEGIPGDLAELGVWRGNTASVLAHFAARHHRKVVLFDTYEGFDAEDLTGLDSDKPMLFKNTSVGLVKKIIGKDSSVCEFIKGYFPDSIEDKHKAMKFCAVSLDCDLYEPTKAGLDFFYPRLSKGGLLLLHDYSSGHWSGCRKAIDEFCKETGELPILMPDKSGSAFIRKHRD